MLAEFGWPGLLCRAGAERARKDRPKGGSETRLPPLVAAPLHRLRKLRKAIKNWRLRNVRFGCRVCGRQTWVTRERFSRGHASRCGFGFGRWSASPVCRQGASARALECLLRLPSYHPTEQVVAGRGCAF